MLCLRCGSSAPRERSGEAWREEKGGELLKADGQPSCWPHMAVRFLQASYRWHRCVR